MSRDTKHRKTIPWDHLSIQDVRQLTGLEAVDVNIGKNWIRITLENGILFTIRNWKVKPIQRTREAVK